MSLTGATSRVRDGSTNLVDSIVGALLKEAAFPAVSTAFFNAVTNSLLLSSSECCLGVSKLKLGWKLVPERRQWLGGRCCFVGFQPKDSP